MIYLPSNLVFKDGVAFIGETSLLDVVKDYGTPLYVLDELTVRDSCRAYRESLKEFYPGDSLPLYASKANSILALSHIIASEKMGIDVVSEGELITALKGGILPERIVFHGNNKSLRELTLA